MKHLSEIILPLKYNLNISLDLNGQDFYGENIIILNCIKKTNVIEFHSFELIIQTIILNNNLIDITKNLTYDKENDINTIYLSDNNILDIGTHELKITFSGQYTAGSGLVKNINSKKGDRTLFFTRFEPNHARKVFPCWDEPNFKVKYNMSIEINDSSYLVLFNTDPIKQLDKRNKYNEISTIYYFQETVPMSTYVMSFMIGKFYFIESYTDNNIRLRVYIPLDRPNEEHTGQLSLDYGIKIMNFITNYYQSPYPFNKLDFIPIDNVDAKGMENYGLIFYDLPFLLFDKSTSTIEHMIGTVNVIAHEIAHQWFGNLVTMNKWNELWLKESFAKFFEYFIIENICPEWDVKSIYIKNLFKTFDFDSIALKSVSIESIKNKQIMQIYDDITYFKGATLLFMIQDYIGKEHFKQSLQKYLNKYKFGTITVNNLIESLIELLDEKQKIYIESIIKTFTTNKGTPIIKFDENNIYVLAFNTRKIIYNIINNKTPLLVEKNKWTIPIKYNVKNSLTDSYFIIEKGKKNYSINDIDIDQDKNNNELNSINIINNKSIGYYRICYTEKQINEIIKNIHNIDHHQQMSIFNDLYITGIYNLCSIKYWITYCFELIKYLITINDPYKHNYYLISTIYSYINNIKLFFDESSVKNIYDQNIINQTNNTYTITLDKILKLLIKHLTIIFDVFNIDNYLKNDLFSNKIQYNSLLLFLLEINESKSDIVINYLIDNKLFNISGDLNKIIIKYIVKNNNIKKLIELKETFPDMDDIIISSLKYTSNNKIIKKMLNSFFIDKTVNLTFDQIIQLINKNTYFVANFTNYFINDYDNYLNIIPLDSKGFTRILNSIILHQTDPSIIEKILNKLESIDNTQYEIKLLQSKNILFNKIFTKINLIKLLNNLL